MGLEERTHPQTGNTPERPHAHADWRQMVGIGLIASVLGIAAGLLIDWFPLQASTQAKSIDTLWDVLIIASVPVFVRVTVIVLFSVIKFRMRPGEENLDGPPIHGNTRLEVIWTTIPAVLLVGLCTYAFIVLENVEASEPNPLQVRVVGEQFAWTFYYQQNGKEVARHVLHLPVNRPVKFTLQAKDVLHDFWVPAFRMKKDAVPGINVTYGVTPNRVGAYPIVCAELCGIGHATMRATAVVEEDAKFTAWLGKLGRPAAAAPAAGWRRRRCGRDGKTIFAVASRLRRLPYARRTPARRHCRPEPRRGAHGQGRGASSSSRSWTRARRSRMGIPDIRCHPDYGDQLGPAKLDALVKYLSEVTKGG